MSQNNIQPQPSQFVLDGQDQEFIRNLVIVKTGVDYDLLSAQDKQKIGLEEISRYFQFLEIAIMEAGNEAEKKHWGMYKASNFNEKLLNSLPTLEPTITELTKIYIDL